MVFSSLKRSEDGVALVIRMYNPAEESSAAQIKLPVAIKTAHTADLQENQLMELPVSPADPQQISVELQPHQIVTLRLTH